MLEKEIERKVNDIAKEYSWLQYKFVSPNKRGVPDRIYFQKGVTICIEFKQKGKKPTALQQKEMQRLNDAGIECHVVDNVNDGRTVFEYYAKLFYEAES